MLFVAFFLFIRKLYINSTFAIDNTISYASIVNIFTFINYITIQYPSSKCVVYFCLKDEEPSPSMVHAGQIAST